MTTGIKQRYAVEDLVVGMYISSLDRPMHQTPFPLEGFYIKTKEQIHELSKYCNYAMVNITKSQFVKDFHITMQLEVIDIPAALTDPKGFKLRQQSRPPRKVKPRQKGRAKRLVFLLAVCVGIWYFV